MPRSGTNLSGGAQLRWVRAAGERRWAAQVDTTSSSPAHGRGEEALLALGMLESYEHMGSFSIECVAGCTCEGVAQQSATHASRTSTYRFVYLGVSQHPACRLRVTSLPQTESGEHKVKFDTLMIGTDMVVNLAGFLNYIGRDPPWSVVNGMMG